MGTKKWKHPRDILLHGHAAHAELRALSLIDAQDSAARAEAVAFLLHVLAGDPAIIRGDIRVAAASALGVLAPDVAHAEVHRQRAALSGTTAAMPPADRAEHERHVLQCALATCASAPCLVCYEAVVALAATGGYLAVRDDQLRAHRDAPSPLGVFYAWFAARLPTLVDADAQTAAKMVSAVGLPYAAASVVDDGARVVLTTVLDDVRLDADLRRAAAEALSEKKDRACAIALASRAGMSTSAVEPKHVVRAVAESFTPAEVYEELAPRLREEAWRDVIIERLGARADPRFLDEAVRLLAEHPHAGVILLDKLSAKSGPTGDRALEELRGFVEAARAEGDGPRSSAARRAHKLIAARLAIRK